MTNRKYEAPAKKRKVVKLNKEAFKLVEDNANEIARALFDSSKGGDVGSTKLLVGLAEGDVEVEDGMIVGPLRSLALKLARAAQRKAKPPDAAVETETEILQPVED